MGLLHTKPPLSLMFRSLCPCPVGLWPLIRLISDCGVGDRAASCVYSLTTQVLCAKSVPRADAVGVPLLRAPNLAAAVWTWKAS